jgi:hypothetical protein
MSQSFYRKLKKNEYIYTQTDQNESNNQSKPNETRPKVKQKRTCYNNFFFEANVGESFPTKCYSTQITLQLAGGRYRVTSKEVGTPVVHAIIN